MPLRDLIFRAVEIEDVRENRVVGRDKNLMGAWLHRDDLMTVPCDHGDDTPVNFDLDLWTQPFEAGNLEPAVEDDVNSGLPSVGRLVSKSDRRKSSDKGASANAKHVIPRFSDGAVAAHSEMRQAGGVALSTPG